MNGNRGSFTAASVGDGGSGRGGRGSRLRSHGAGGGNCDHLAGLAFGDVGRACAGGCRDDEWLILDDGSA